MFGRVTPGSQEYDTLRRVYGLWTIDAPSSAVLDLTREVERFAHELQGDPFAAPPARLQLRVIEGQWLESDGDRRASVFQWILAVPDGQGDELVHQLETFPPSLKGKLRGLDAKVTPENLVDETYDGDPDDASAWKTFAQAAIMKNGDGGTFEGRDPDDDDDE